jgi:hypothetical protein
MTSALRFHRTWARQAQAAEENYRIELMTPRYQFRQFGGADIFNFACIGNAPVNSVGGIRTHPARTTYDDAAGTPAVSAKRRYAGVP